MYWHYNFAYNDWLAGMILSVYGKLLVSAVMLQNFRHKYMNAISMYVLCIWKLFMQECLKVRYEACT